MAGGGPAGTGGFPRRGKGKRRMGRVAKRPPGGLAPLLTPGEGQRTAALAWRPLARWTADMATETRPLMAWSAVRPC